MSDILIKNEKMPKNCEECPLNYYECALLDKFAEEIMMYYGGNSRHPDCPLIEVPKHGRLIDADCCNGYFYEHMSDDMMICAMNAINEMPTIIESESGNES